MNDLSLIVRKLRPELDLVLIEKPYVYTDGKLIRSSSFPNGKKVELEEVSGNSLEEIIAGLNTCTNKFCVVVRVKDGIITTNDNGKVKVQCLTV